MPARGTCRLNQDKDSPAMLGISLQYWQYHLPIEFIVPEFCEDHSRGLDDRLRERCESALRWIQGRHLIPRVQCQPQFS